MTSCKQCGRTASIWNRDIWTGLCKQCQSVPSNVRPHTSKRLLAITITFALVTAVAALIYCTPILDDYFLNRPFSSDEWLTAGTRERGKMARDLVSSGRLRKKTKAELEEILGPPDVRYGSVIAYRVDIGYRWIFAPSYSEVQVMFEKERDIVYGAFLH